jgi:hypothetical protein
MYIYLLPDVLAHVLNPSVRGLHHVLIYVSYNKILFLLYLFQLVQQYLYLSCERVCMARLDEDNILPLGHLVRSRLGGTHDSISIQNLGISQLRMPK